MDPRQPPETPGARKDERLQLLKIVNAPREIHTEVFGRLGVRIEDVERLLGFLARIA